MVPRAEAANIFTSKLVFKQKEIVKRDGSPGTKHRARLVVRGFQKKEGLDFHDTYAPGVKFTTLRMFFALVAHRNLHCHEMDVKTAFQNGDLDQDVFMKQPEGRSDPKNSEFVCKLQKLCMVSTRHRGNGMRR